MDTLYLSIKRLEELRTICSDELLSDVLGKYADKHQIIITNGEHPSGLWIIDEFLKDQTVYRINKIQVIIALAYLGVHFQFEDGRDTIGATNVLCILLRGEYISQMEFENLVDLLAESIQGTSPLKFQMHTQPDWAR